jgi:uncharacterized protein with PQ loop repeat
LELGYIIGYVGILFGLGVAPPQLIKIIKTNSSSDISLATYLFLCIALVCYLLHAIYIHALVFIIAQSINIVVNAAIFIVLLQHRRRRT